MDMSIVTTHVLGPDINFMGKSRSGLYNKRLLPSGISKVYES